MSFLQAKYQWLTATTHAERAQHLAMTAQVSLPIARLLSARGFTSEQALTFLQPLTRDALSSPALLEGITDAAEHIWRTIQKDGTLLIFGDYDVDGITATTILSKTIRHLGGQVNAFFPKRLEAGYGLTMASINQCLKQQNTPPNLLITVDCGITAVAEVAELNRQGITVIITDHHEPAAQLPPAHTIINPKLNPQKATRDLCGAGVAYKLAHALMMHAYNQGHRSDAKIAGELIVMAGLATVADIVPLQAENRYLVAQALKLWPKHAGIGLRELLHAASSRTTTNPDSYTFGFLLAPRLNAAGRLASAKYAYELLNTDDRERARFLAKKLNDLNGERRGHEGDITQVAKHLFQSHKKQSTTSPAAIVVADARNALEPTLLENFPLAKTWHPGVIGIVAARLCERYGLPTAIISFNGTEQGQGSVRVPGTFHALKALDACRELLIKYGGHQGAAGFSIAKTHLDAFKQGFRAACEAQTQAGAIGLQLHLDGWLEPQAISWQLMEDIKKLAPWGHGNPTPCWALAGVVLENITAMGPQKNHLRATLKLPDNHTLNVVWFGIGQQRAAQVMAAQQPLDLVFELHENYYQGTTTLQLQLLDARSSPGA